MPFDAVFLSAVIRETAGILTGARIDKIYAPEKEDVVLICRGSGGPARLFITCNPQRARMHLTGKSSENPAAPPMFCMLLRKHIAGGRIRSIEQPEMERVARIVIDCMNEMGDPVCKTLAVELIGRHSNIILVDGDGRIIDSLRRVDFDMSERRQVLPGLFYRPPPAQEGKLSPLTVSREEFADICGQHPGRDDGSWLLSKFCGLSPLICRELFYRAGLREGLPSALANEFFGLVEDIKKARFVPFMLLRDGEPKDYCYTPVGQYEGAMEGRVCASFSELLDDFYSARDFVERMRRKSADLVKTASSALARAERKLLARSEELEAARNREGLRECGDLLMANLSAVEKGAEAVRVENFFDPESGAVNIKLDARLSAQQNAAKYYREYSRFKNAERVLTGQIEAARIERVHLDAVLDSLKYAENDRDLHEVREELAETGYLKRAPVRGKPKKEPPAAPMRFMSAGGLQIVAGKNNRQNEEVTFRISGKRDTWLHVKNEAGSHVVILSGGVEVGEETLRQAAVIAAWFSGCRESSGVAVDYTLVKNVKKIPGAGPGMVTYSDYRTVFVTPEKEAVERLRV